MKITDFENRRSFKCIWLNSQFREEVSEAGCYALAVISASKLVWLWLWFTRSVGPE